MCIDLSSQWDFVVFVLLDTWYIIQILVQGWKQYVCRTIGRRFVRMRRGVKREMSSCCGTLIGSSNTWPQWLQKLNTLDKWRYARVYKVNYWSLLTFDSENGLDVLIYCFSFPYFQKQYEDHIEKTYPNWREIVMERARQVITLNYLNIQIMFTIISRWYNDWIAVMRFSVNNWIFLWLSTWHITNNTPILILYWIQFLGWSCQCGSSEKGAASSNVGQFICAGSLLPAAAELSST